MDFSGSMSSHKNNLQSTATDIANAIGQITPNYTIGFGGFCDKPILEFGSSKENIATESCVGFSSVYITTCGFLAA